jgi:cardiolipin synthase
MRVDDHVVVPRAMHRERSRLPRRRRLRRQGIPRDWRYRLAPKLKGRPKGRPSLWARLRRVVWWWWPWAVASGVFAYTRQGGWASAAALIALVNYLVAPTEGPPQYGLDHEFAIDSGEFLATVAGACGMPFTRGNRLDILNNGEAFYPAMLDAIARAACSVTIEAYIYWDGEIGRQLATRLAAKAREGVPVKILLDAVGSATIGTEILQILESGGCQLAWYNRIHWYTLGRFNHRTHRKSLILDGRVGFTGGAGIADHWSGHAQDPDHWRDIQIRLEGPAVAPLQTGFAHNWLQTTGELISGDPFYPPPQSCGTLPAVTLMSSPEVGASTVRTMYYLSITCARTAIDIANPYFVPDEVAVQTLIEAKQRGVAVRIMVSGIHNDNWLARHNSIRLYGALLRAGIAIYEFNRTMLHQKTMVVDGLWVTIGTTNFDNRSFAHNEESNVCICDRALAAQMHATFEDDLRGCDLVTLEGWRRRGVVQRGREIVASFLEAQV